tara:strand:- start:13472 stop:14227 length:756 start_codon:yes stop_codon:yes gene_type:complete
MKISVITVSYNAEKTIGKCIESVLSQTYTNSEYIIIDGNSKDTTMNIVESFRDRIDIVVSETDSGIYDAINKGIALATGDVVAILNSDDEYVDKYVLETVMQEFLNNSDISIVYGDIVIVDNVGRIMRTWRSGRYTSGLFRTGWHPPHPSFFVKKSVYDKYGVFNTTFEIAADYEFMLRVLEKNQTKSIHIPQILVRMLGGGASNGSIRAIILGNRESMKAWSINGMNPPLLLIVRKLLIKIRQYFVKTPC